MHTQPQLFDQANMNNVASINNAVAVAPATSTPTPMAIKQITLQKCLAMLNACGCKYAVIDEQGTKHGTLELAPPAAVVPIKPPKKRKYHGVTEYIKSQLEGTLPGGSALVLPNEQYPMNAIRNTTASTCIKLWGEGNYKTHAIDGGIEVLRFA